LDEPTLKKFLKIVGYSLGVIVLLVIGSMLFGLYMVSESSEHMVEGEQFGNTASKDQCLFEMADRVSECGGTSCLISGIGFGTACLEVAEGSRNLYCSGKQAVTNLPNNYCEGYPESKYCSQAIPGAVSNYCSGILE
jgi:hypothetical protein